MAGTRTLQNFLRTIVDPPQAQVDVVAVHGLNPTNTDFHAEQTWTANGKLWLRDFFPSRAPTARVLLFGYNANVAFETSSAGVLEQAENLLNRLRSKRIAEPDRPLLLLCHSLGGVVVKQALVHAKLDDSYSQIRNATFGIAFFGTPHQGSDFAYLGDVAAKIARIALRNPKSTFMEALKRDSIFSDTIIQHFRHMLEDFHILSFYETRPLKKIGIIVDKHSATLGLPGTRENQIAVDADHNNVCKFERDDDDTYVQVADNLMELINKGLQGVADRDRLAKLKSPLSVSKMGLSEEQQCLRSLFFPEMDFRVNDIANPADDTCEWLLTHPSFLKWEESHSGLLWITGKPGAGKSTLMKHVLRKESNDTIIIASFFFNARGSVLEKSSLGLYRSMLHRLICFSPRQLAKVTATYQHRFQTYGEIGKRWNWHENELRDYLSDVLLDIADCPVRLYVDALDEGGEEMALQLVEHFQRLVTKVTRATKLLGICFSCRHYPIIALNGITICVEDENSADVRTYVLQRFEDNFVDKERAEVFMEDILERANGVFQWVTLVLSQVIRECKRGKSTAAVQRLIRTLPPKLHELYENLLTETEDDERSDLIIVMRWLCFAFESLSLQQLRHAIAVEANPSYTTLQECLDEEPSATNDDGMRMRIIEISKGLAQVQVHGGHNVVQLIHESVKDFLLQGGLESLEPQGFGSSSGRAHLHLASTCVRYLNMKDVSSIVSKKRIEGQNEESLDDIAQEIMSPYPLILYAVTSWVPHAETVRDELALQDSLLQLLYKFHGSKERQMQQWVALFPRFSRYNGFRPNLGTKILHILAQHGFSNAMEMWLHLGYDAADPQDRLGRTPLSYAAQMGHEHAVRLLLDRDDVQADRKDRYYNRTPLSHAAQKGHVEVVKLFLERDDVDTNSKDKYGITPLAWTFLGDQKWRQALDKASGERFDTQKVLENTKPGKPLSYAAIYERGTHKHAMVAKLLVAAQHNADVNLRDSGARSSLAPG
ncbi:MAG: hypothetical protein Q9165_005103 [Trypethelium subeluteriae]